jgi:hypothetical protein
MKQSENRKVETDIIYDRKIIPVLVDKSIIMSMISSAIGGRNCTTPEQKVPNTP